MFGKRLLLSLLLAIGCAVQAATLINDPATNGCRSKTFGGGPLTGPWATITLGYDALGHLTSRDVDGTTDSDVIDPDGRLTSASNPLGIFQYGYATAFSPLLTSVSYPKPNGQTTAQTTALHYNGNAGDQRLQEIWNKDASGNTISKFCYEYDALGLGEITKWKQQAGTDPTTADAFTYDSAQQLTGAVLTSATGTVQKSYGYIYDSVGNRIYDAADTMVNQYSINNLNQLVGSQGGTGVLPIRGTVDKAVTSVTVNGNAASVNGLNFEGSANVIAGPNTVTVAATDLNNNVVTKPYQITVTGSGSQTLHYDDNGNLQDDGFRTYEWDPLNRLTAINYTGTSPALGTEFTYNGLGQRVKIAEKSGGSVASEKHFIWIPGNAQPTEQRAADNSVTARFYAQGEQLAGNNYYYTRDHLGSVREMVDAMGTLRARYGYDPFGVRSTNQITTNPVEADFGFTGDYWHADPAPETTGLWVTLNRLYDPDSGRWLNRDPIDENGGLNIYESCNNDPVVNVDPSGQEQFAIWASAYIPQKTFLFPYGTNPLANWYGDGRSAPQVFGRSRAYHFIVIETNPCVQNPSVINSSGAGVTKVTTWFGKTITANDTVPPIAKITRKNNDHITEVQFGANTTDPLVSYAPSLHYNYDLIFDTSAGTLTIKGNIKKFPAYDLTINGSTRVNYVPSGASNSPLALELPAGPIPAIAPITIKKY